MLGLVDWARASRGLSRLRVSPELELAAERKEDAILHCGFSHTPCRKPSRSFLREAGYGSRHRWNVGENLAIASWPFSARTVFALWLRSEKHRANILNPGWRDVGLVERRGEWGPTENAAVWVVELGWTRAR